ncbi:hypothetical protein QCD70_13950 [Agreia sp. PsM10]|uniref:hypothetical protein n=1 Tax=Agreia sp. PsM10 TaxID=3030533 RepID=UPI00263BCF34|nr:hypothetical protein [Agreia sp. PsM10]MDN4641356.1 hypothetical protein [Agreia sp. PsM10]
MTDDLEQPQPVEVSDTRHLLELMSLDDIYYVNLSVERVSNDDVDLDQGPRLSHDIFSRYHAKAMSVRLSTTVEAKDAVYHVDIVTDYESEVEVASSEDIRRDFIERVAIMAAWPYLRVAVADLSARMRTEQITLGLFKPGDITLGDSRPADPETGLALEPDENG